jgi:hypothetical protein
MQSENAKKRSPEARTPEKIFIDALRYCELVFISFPSWKLWDWAGNLGESGSVS